jgi:hypothetical protein
MYAPQRAADAQGAGSGCSRRVPAADSSNLSQHMYGHSAPCRRAHNRTFYCWGRGLLSFPLARWRPAPALPAEPGIEEGHPAFGILRQQLHAALDRPPFGRGFKRPLRE